MEKQEHIVTLDWFGQVITLKTGKLAKQANAAVVAECDDTVVLSAVTMGKNIEEDPGFFPLSVHYLEKFYARGKIPGGFLKREGKPSDRAVLTSRIIDRSIRPLFPEGFRNEVQIVPNLISMGDSASPDVLAGLASSAALLISNIPFDKPVALVRVSLRDGQFYLNRLFPEDSLDLDLTLSVSRDGLTMIEGIANKISNEKMVEALEYGFKAGQSLIQLQEDLRKVAGKTKIAPHVFVPDSSLEQEVVNFAKNKILSIFSVPEKIERYKAMDTLFDEVEKHFSHSENSLRGKQAKSLAHDLEYHLVRDRLFETNHRVDGRAPGELRHIEVEAGIYPRLHGSALFTRGETQSLGILTLGSSSDEQKIDGVEPGDHHKRYMLHYNFPNFSVGEVGKISPPGRREIGHGYLAEKALKAVIPPQEEFPYTIRLVSEILESNGSSSMASVCSCCLAMLQGGVPISDSVAGIAMGLMFNHDKSQYKILTDIQGIEDHYGDIDFKVAGTKEGITAFQLDIKMDAVKIDLLREALEQAHQARLTILDKMNEVISKPNQDVSPFAPKVLSLKSNPDNIRYLIGPGGKTIKALTEEYGVSIDVLPTGEVRILTPSTEVAEKVKEKVLFYIRDIHVGDILEGKVTKITNFGAFIEVAAGREGLCHISKISHERVNVVEDFLKEGQIVRVKVLDLDRQGKISLSIKDV